MVFSPGSKQPPSPAAAAYHGGNRGPSAEPATHDRRPPPVTAHFARPDRHAGLARLADRRFLRELAYVDGKWTAGSAGQTTEVRDPSSDAPVAWVTTLDADEAARAVRTEERRVGEEGVRTGRSWRVPKREK